ncbi:hypothetical protein [Sphingomonas sp.]|uniref:hypothetical protein n=1 Tax=Sphingomonas sp. TaxID=28214 RepID=UPI00286AEB72|nr:hypothetical protein [Sphingomonas sp.]
MEKADCRVAFHRGFSTVHLLREIEVFLRSSGVPAARFGRDALNDPRFVFDLRRGREPRPQTIARVVGFLEDAR